MPQPELNDRRIEVDGLVSVLTEAGAGREVVLLPSMLVRTASYRRTIRSLVHRGFRVTSVEMPGSGRASRIMHPWDFHHYGQWLCQLLRQLKLDRPILIGHSDSAGAALVAASLCPNLIDRLVLCAGVGFDLKFSFFRIATGRMIDVPLEPDFSMIAAVDVAYNMCRHFRNFFHHVWICTNTDLREDARKIRVPTLLAWGARDHAIPIRCANLAMECIADCRLYVSKHGSHDWIGDHTEEFAEMISKWAAVAAT